MAEKEATKLKKYLKIRIFPLSQVDRMEPALNSILKHYPHPQSIQFTQITVPGSRHTDYLFCAITGYQLTRVSLIPDGLVEEEEKHDPIEIRDGGQEPTEPHYPGINQPRPVNLGDSDSQQETSPPLTFGNDKEGDQD